VAALGEAVVEGPAAAGVLRSPGQLVQHYAPRARLFLWQDETPLRAGLVAAGLAPSACWVIAHAQIPAGPDWAGVSVIPHDAEAYARALYAEWHRCDEEGVAAIAVQTLPDGPEWRGIADRLQRASAMGAS